MDVVRSSPPLGSGGYLTSVLTIWQKASCSHHRQMVDGSHWKKLLFHALAAMATFSVVAILA
jgi:hypothetical protein